MNTTKKEVLLDYNMKIVFSGGGLTFGVGDKNVLEESLLGGFFQVGGGKNKFLASGQGLPSFP